MFRIDHKPHAVQQILPQGLLEACTNNNVLSIYIVERCGIILTRILLRFTMGKRKGNPSNILTQEIETTAQASSHRPRGRVHRFLDKVKGGANKLRSLSKDSRSRSPALPNVSHDERASSTPNIAVQGVEVEAHTQSESALQDAQQATARMHLLSGPVTTVASIGQDAHAGLDAASSFQDTYLKPLRIFDTVIEKIADVHPYAKMALGVLSYAANVCFHSLSPNLPLLLSNHLCRLF
ncbi:hypothetical protein BDR07DRAFT_361807 [Suillus spraguei]|nr:hypothetical protein BDR07DRAFT_361807 [Suillus spraguei]